MRNFIIFLAVIFVLVAVLKNTTAEDIAGSTPQTAVFVAK